MKYCEPFAFAGLWESWQPSMGEALTTFTILTTKPNELMAPIHDRMPVIIAPENYERWLGREEQPDSIIDLLQPYTAEEMEAWTVSERVSKVENNDPGLLAPYRPTQETLFNRL
jgi:putative SOS response-associated peptidase YedK